MEPEDFYHDSVATVCSQRRLIPRKIYPIILSANKDLRDFHRQDSISRLSFWSFILIIGRGVRPLLSLGQVLSGKSYITMYWFLFLTCEKRATSKKDKFSVLL